MNDDWDDDVLFTRTRTGDPDTSRAAIASIGEEGITKTQAKVYFEMQRTGVYGRTGEELSYVFGTKGSTYRTRLSELGRKGLCVMTKRKRYVDSGNLAHVWVHHSFATPEDTYVADERDGPIRRVRREHGQAATDKLRPRGAAEAPEGDAAARERSSGGGNALDGGDDGVPRGAAPRGDDGVDKDARHR